MAVVLNRRKTFTISSSIPLSFGRERWIYDADVLSNLRHLVVEKSRSWSFRGPDPHEIDYETFVECCEPFHEVIRRVQNLKSLTWNAGPVPHTLLETLHSYHPKAVLKVFKFDRFDSSLDRLDNAETALTRFPTLTHLRASGRLPRDSERAPQYSLAAFKNIVANSRSLRYAGIVIANGTNQVKFPQSEGELLGNGSIKRKKCQSLRSLTLDGAELKLSKDSLTELERYIETKHLESLKFSRGLPDVSYFEIAATMLPNLKHVSLNFSGITGTSLGDKKTQQPVLKAARDYLLECPPLQTLSLWAWNRVINLQDLIDRHGKTLMTLQLHEKEGLSTWTESDRVDQRPDVSPADVQLLRRSCLSLRDLTIDMTRHHKGFELQAETDMLQLLDELAYFKPQLRKLQIYLDTNGLAAFLYARPDDDLSTDDEEGNEDEGHVGGSDDEVVEGHTVEAGWDTTSSPRKRLPTSTAKGQKEPADPEMVLQEYVQSIWKRLFGSATTGERLLDVKFGEWESKYVLQRNAFEGDSRRFFEVRPHERDDHIGECVVKMRKK